tara:strand:- start:387 stop:1007 length:621 start_codon:yes stop_codon:yes gene_type:complete
MINLFTSYYSHPQKRRNEEIHTCLVKNLQNPLIDNVYLLIEKTFDGFDQTESKLHLVNIKERPTFNNFFEIASKYAQSDTISIIANSDIYFDQTLLHAKLIGGNECYALTRWDIKDGKAVFFNRADSQDSWIFRGRIRKVDEGDFYQGYWGCDNRIALELENSGYEVTNPSRTIRSCHLDTYQRSRINTQDHTIPPPYKLLPPTTL